MTNYEIYLTVSEKQLLIKLLQKSIDFSLTSRPIDLDMSPTEQEIANILLQKLKS